MNTTAKGNQFRSHVLDLLRTKYPDASTEIPVSWKNSDIFFTGMDFGRRVKFAVECKNYEKKLTTSDFQKIISDYQQAFNKQEIDTLLIISKNDVEAASRRLILDTPRVRFLTYNELEDWLVGLRPYITHLANVFTDDDVHAYYIEGRFQGHDKNALEVLREWISSDSVNGLAILGGYGVGKSSLAKKLASDQAKRYLDNPANERMPILLRLGQVVHETELSALFGKEFTALFPVEGYSYKTLMHFNDLGRLLIILDGFDEMKHAMSEADFRSNFREFNKLRGPDAKVLLLGRPSAFTSESSDLLIKGLGSIAGQQYLDEDFPAWQEEKLSFFSRSEAHEFLTRYLHFTSQKRGEFRSEKIIGERVQEVLSDVHEDIWQRPVQARIVGQLAATNGYSFKNINRFKLYNDFVARVVDRDQEKLARRVIPHESRMLFLEDLAIWAWTRDHSAQGVFKKNEVPQTLFDKLPNGNALDFKSKRSEYLVSSLTEQKDSDVLYFAHRSFQEFLVASSISKTGANVLDEERFIAICKAITYEVADFLDEVEDNSYLLDLYSSISPKFMQSLHTKFLTLFRKNEAIINSILDSKPMQLSVYDPLILGFPDLNFGNNPVNGNVVVQDKLLDAIKHAKANVACTAFISLMIASNSNEVLFLKVLAACFTRLYAGTTNESISNNCIVVQNEHYGVFGEVISTSLKKVRNLQNRRYVFEFENAMQAVIKNLGAYVTMIELMPHQKHGAVSIDSKDLELHMDEKTIGFMKKIYALKTDGFNFVPKVVKGKSYSQH